MEELYLDEGVKVQSSYPFKGNMDIDKFQAVIEKYGASKIAFVRMEAGANLIGGQPFSLENMQEVRRICEKHGLLLVLDASLLADNLYFIKKREEKCKKMSIREITRALADLSDIIYFSARKLGVLAAAGFTNNKEIYQKIRELIPLYEGFLTYGACLSVKWRPLLSVWRKRWMKT